MEKDQKHSSLEKVPEIKGLILIGGKSTRMGQDKSQLNYFGKPQKEVLKELLEDNGLETFYSVRDFSKEFILNKDEKLEITNVKSNVIANEVKQSLSCSEVTSSKTPRNDMNEIPDSFYNLGPFGGICSAFQKDPNSAWLVLATDLPFVDDKLIKLLLQKRNINKVATSIKGKSKNFVEPLITIYEPKAFPILLKYLEMRTPSPRKMLMNSDIEIVEVEDDLIKNINTLQEFIDAKNKLKKIEQ